MKTRNEAGLGSCIELAFLALALAFACIAKASPLHGSGYQAPSNRSCYRAQPGGPAINATGNLATPDPFGGESWNGGAAANPAQYFARYGYPVSDVRGGWCNSPGNELQFRLATAMQWHCSNNPARIRSIGAAGGLDCIPTMEEMTDAATFDVGWQIVWDYEAATGGHVPRCGDGQCDYGEEMSSAAGCISDCHTCSNGQPATCATCPTRVPPGVICAPVTPPPMQCSAPCINASACVVPPPPVLLPVPANIRATVNAAAGWLPTSQKAKRAQLAALAIWLAQVQTYHPGAPSTALMDLKLYDCDSPGVTLRQCLGEAP